MFTTLYLATSRLPCGRFCFPFVTGLALLLAGITAPAQAPVDPKPPADAQFASQAEQAFNATRSHFNSNSNNPDACRNFARAAFDWADYATTDARRADIAEQGIASCRRFLQLDSNAVAAHYYLALNFGQLARTKSWGALKIVNQMEEEFEAALKLDATFDYYGPDRGLGLLYLETPGWPLSLGSKTKARQHLQKALKAAADFPENHLNLIEADLKWGDKKSAAAGLKSLAEIWPAARRNLTGDTWAPSWSDWTKRRAAAEKKAGVKPGETEPAPDK